MNIFNDLKIQYRSGNVTTKLIFWNIALFIFPEVIFAILKLFTIFIDYHQYIALSNSFADLVYKPWTLISYNFFHGSFFHLLSNVLMLNFIGTLFTTYFTQKQLLGLYFLGGIFGGFIYMLSYALLPLLAHQSAILVGASASVMAILWATTTYNPYFEVKIPLIGFVKLWHIALIFLVIDLIQLPLTNSGGHLAHLGGAMFGYIFINFIKNGTDLTLYFNKGIDFATNLFSTKKATPFKKVHKNNNNQNFQKNNLNKDLNQQQIDEILDKISKSGYDSLSVAEKEFLFKAG